ncbi:loganic acid O-methyltransferase-like [Tripterygium wilfordii]|uniref:loganic acid O-methyltransferase-like n=1 Tax=Tripterygium wilfordii TaxID=458696 RepID=UPI0018F7F173|nr:loganic acid O-methyltransferase-like [Tripterygium wilfordii]
MALVIPGVPDGIPHLQCNFVALHALLEACLTEKHDQGSISEAKIDSFNLPIYNPTEAELKGLIENNNNDCFSIEKMESVIYNEEVLDVTEQMATSHVRAVWEGVISDYFGNDIVDELFDRYAKKFTEAFLIPESTSYERMVLSF